MNSKSDHHASLFCCKRKHDHEQTIQGPFAARYRPPPHAHGASAANGGGFQTSLAFPAAADGGHAGGDEIPVVYGSSVSGGGGGFTASGGGYGGSSSNGGGGAGDGIRILPEARAVSPAGMVVAEPYNASRTHSIAAATVPIWRAATPTASVYPAPYDGVRGERSPGVREVTGTTYLRFGSGVDGAGGGVAAPSAPPLSPYLIDDEVFYDPLRQPGQGVATPVLAHAVAANRHPVTPPAAMQPAATPVQGSPCPSWFLNYAP